MFKLIVLSCLLAAAVAAPGVLTPVHTVSLVPSAVSHQSIVQTHNPTVVVKHHVSPVLVNHAPIVHSVPVVQHAVPVHHVVPSAVSHQSIVQTHKSGVLIRSHEPYVRLHHTPIVRVHHAPALNVVRHAPVYQSAPLVHTGLTYAAHAPVVRVL